MILPLTTYPQYRKYKNGKSFFRIHSPVAFDEVQVMGKSYTLHVFVAKILPDRNFIYDMTFDYLKNWEESNAAEFGEALSNVG
jgi:hypothetical protein